MCDEIAKKMNEEETKMLLSAYRDSVSEAKHYKARLLELGIDVDAKKEKKKKKKKPKPAKPCRNGGLRLKELDPAMTPVERTQLRNVHTWLYQVLKDISATKVQLNNLEKEFNKLGITLSLGNVDRWMELAGKAKELLKRIQQLQAQRDKALAKQKEILMPVIKRVKEINSREPFKPKEVLKKFEKPVETKEGTPKKASYTLSRQDALVLVKEIADMLKANPTGQRIEVFITSNM